MGRGASELLLNVGRGPALLGREKQEVRVEKLAGERAWRGPADERKREFFVLIHTHCARFGRDGMRSYCTGQNEVRVGSYSTKGTSRVQYLSFFFAKNYA